MNPITANPVTAIQYARQVREEEQRAIRRHDRAVRAARAARSALQRAGH